MRSVRRRLNSMSAAAELGVTHGAISRHVRSLETEFGLPLLKRLPRSVERTVQGGPLAATPGVRNRPDTMRLAGWIEAETRATSG
ncbi:LysR family transcriptional regulator [Bosea sp. (in: a-proteobacteria)]|uniref:LysR family transcriptional regulator n=1 Tax=Bosea sp. (in: a-proteobacteria) TaxID=1871050 RepID=UPI002733802F|nr:LysR family transcriptional regulator [Bosea sp. (in: a-proteobacteria)]MDP3257426.1 LysR family transcriptional regulator [Bosea sp. (in: a-proteobacteria)]